MFNWIKCLTEMWDVIAITLFYCSLIIYTISSCYCSIYSNNSKFYYSGNIAKAWVRLLGKIRRFILLLKFNFPSQLLDVARCNARQLWEIVSERTCMYTLKWSSRARTRVLRPDNEYRIDGICNRWQSRQKPLKLIC